MPISYYHSDLKQQTIRFYHIKKQLGKIRCTFKEPILIAQACFSRGAGETESEHTEEEGQSPQEQPREGSLHE